MKVFGLWTLLSTALLGQVSLAEPIPADVRVRSLRLEQREGGKVVVEGVAKRALTDDVLGMDGSGPRYWAWSKLAYDEKYNDQPGRDLGPADGKPWAKLEGSQIFVKGYKGKKVPTLSHWPVFTGMRVVVGLDSTQKAIVMAFIGSNDRPTFKQDLKFTQITDSSKAVEGQVEKGFFECYESVYKQAFEWAEQYAKANSAWDIVITGHSLGGPTAQIAAVAFASTYPDFASRMTVFTYGAPRAGDLTFQQKLAANQGIRMANFQHRKDMVPIMPFIHSMGNIYANAASRRIWTPADSSSSWSDTSLWTQITAADEERAGFREGFARAAADFIKGFSQHTGYFSTSTGTLRRSTSLTGNEKTSVTSLRKRDPPTEDDLVHIQGLIGQIRQSHQLMGQPQLTPELEEFTQLLRMTNEQAELIQILGEFDTEDDRVDLLTYTVAFAMEQQ